MATQIRRYRSAAQVKIIQTAALTEAQQFCAIRSYLSTAVKHGKHCFDILVMLAEGRSWLPTIQ